MPDPTVAPLTRPALVQLVSVLAERLAEAPDRETEAEIMRRIFQHSTTYMVLTAQAEKSQ